MGWFNHQLVTSLWFDITLPETNSKFTPEIPGWLKKWMVGRLRPLVDPLRIIAIHQRHRPHGPTEIRGPRYRANAESIVWLRHPGGFFGEANDLGALKGKGVKRPLASNKQDGKFVAKHFSIFFFLIFKK